MLIRGDLARSLDQEFSGENMNLGRQSTGSRCEFEGLLYIETEEGNLSDEGKMGERDQRADKRGEAKTVCDLPARRTGSSEAIFRGMPLRLSASASGLVGVVGGDFPVISGLL